jgi:hypothetical protein
VDHAASADIGGAGTAADAKTVVQASSAAKVNEPALEQANPEAALESPAPILPPPQPIPKEIIPVSLSQPPPASAELKLVEDPLVSALRCYLNKRPHEAVNWLDRYDKSTQEVLLTLLPVVAQATQGGPRKSSPDEMTMMQSQLEGLANALRPKARLLADHLCLCWNVEKFGVYKKIADDYVLHPGDPVQVYVEFKNFSSVWDGCFHCIRLASRLEIRDYRRNFVWTPKFPNRDSVDRSLTPRHDFYKVYFFDIPRHIPPGLYTLFLQVTDLPTGRTCDVTVDFQVGVAHGS